VQDEDGFVLFSARNGGLQGGFPAPGNGEIDHVWSITGTLDHLLTDQLMVRFPFPRHPETQSTRSLPTHRTRPL
jgi:hypothetical protein